MWPTELTMLTLWSPHNHSPWGWGVSGVTEHDWWLSQLHASCPRSYPLSAALSLPLQPSFDGKQEVSRLDSVLSWVCGTRGLMTPRTGCLGCVSLDLLISSWDSCSVWHIKLSFCLPGTHPSKLLFSCGPTLGFTLVDDCAVSKETGSGGLTQQLHIFHQGDCRKLLWLTALLSGLSPALCDSAVAYLPPHPTESRH